MTEGFTGAEIEQAVIDALYDAFDEGKPMTSVHIAGAIERVIPLSKSMPEEIRAMRSFVKEGRAKSASRTESAETEKGRRIRV